MPWGLQEPRCDCIYANEAEFDPCKPTAKLPTSRLMFQRFQKIRGRGRGEAVKPTRGKAAWGKCERAKYRLYNAVWKRGGIRDHETAGVIKAGTAVNKTWQWLAGGIREKVFLFFILSEWTTHETIIMKISLMNLSWGKLGIALEYWARMQNA